LLTAKTGGRFLMLRVIFVTPRGERACRVFRTAGNPNDLTLLIEWDDLELARGYMNSEELRKRMNQAGVVGVPEIHYLAEMYSIHRSAAD